MESLLILKPHAVADGKHREFVKFLASKDLKIKDMKFFCGAHKESLELYQEHREKDWFGDLIEMMSRGYWIAYKVVGKSVEEIRETALEFRYKYQVDATNNVIHASDNEEKAKRELSILKF